MLRKRGLLAHAWDPKNNDDTEICNKQTRIGICGRGITRKLLHLFNSLAS